MLLSRNIRIEIDRVSEIDDQKGIEYLRLIYKARRKVRLCQIYQVRSMIQRFNCSMGFIHDLDIQSILSASRFDENEGIEELFPGFEIYDRIIRLYNTKLQEYPMIGVRLPSGSPMEGDPSSVSSIWPSRGGKAGEGGGRRVLRRASCQESRLISHFDEIASYTSMASPWIDQWALPLIEAFGSRRYEY